MLTIERQDDSCGQACYSHTAIHHTVAHQNSHVFYKHGTFNSIKKFINSKVSSQYSTSRGICTLDHWYKDYKLIFLVKVLKLIFTVEIDVPPSDMKLPDTNINFSEV